MKTLRMILPLSMVLLLSLRSDDPFIKSLIAKIESYANNYASERIFVHTDNDIYKSGDDIWFRAYAFNSLEKKLSALSHTLYIRVLGYDGKELATNKYYMDNGIAEGSIKLPSKADEGRYMLIGYTSRMKNQPPDEVFQKEFILREKNFNRLLLSITSDAALMLPGKTVNISGSLATNEGNPLKEQAMEFAITAVGKAIAKGKFTTGNSGQFNIQFKPENMDMNGRIMLETKGRADKENLFGAACIPLLIPPFTLSFFPEGGTLITGEETKLAFMAYDKKGFAFPVEGHIFNSKGQPVADFSSGKQKWGLMIFKPAEGEKYFGKITKPEGIDLAFNLPEVKSNGINLQVGILRDTLLNIKTSSHGMPGQKAYLLARRGSNIFWVVDLDPDHPCNFNIPSEMVSTGIADLAILDTLGRILNERPVYVNKKSQAKLISESEKTLYGNREKVVISLVVKDQNDHPLEAIISGSVAVGGSLESIPDFPAYMNVTSDFKAFQDLSIFRTSSGYNFNDPGYIFFGGRFSSFDWNAAIESGAVKNPYRSYEGIAGTVYDNTNKLARSGFVRLMNNSNQELQQVEINEKGEFRFDPFNPTTSNQEFTLNATSIDNKDKYNIYVDDSFEKALSEYMRTQGYEMEARSADVSSSTRTSDNRNFYQKYYEPGRSLLDIIKQIKYYTIVNNQIVFQGGMNSFSFQSGALLVLDGVQLGTDIGSLNGINPSDVADIKIFTDAPSIQRYTGFNVVGVIDIVTKRGNESNEYPVSSKIYKLHGYISAGKFNSPDYSNTEVKSKTNKDMRTTLFWQPNLILAKDGKSTLEFYTSDIRGKFRGIFQGLAANGSPVYGTFEFDVK